MSNPIFVNPSVQPIQSAPRLPASEPADLARIFNTALVATRSDITRDFAGELAAIMGSSELAAILSAIRQHARFRGISERQAAEQIIRTFRKLDQIWSDYIFQEGIDRVQNEDPASD